MKLIVGLGNPGRRYRGTRHNVGWEVIARLSRRSNIPVDEDAGWAEIGRGQLGNQRVILVRPQTYVNVAGIAVRDLRRRHRVRLEDIFVVVDDLDLLLGRIRLRPRGRAGGHNGLKSVIEALGSSDFPRLRVGIGRPPAGVDPAEYVLSRFRADEHAAVEGALDRAAQTLEVAVTEGVEVAMNQFNAKAE